MLPLTRTGSAAPLLVLSHAPTRPTWHSENSQALVVLKEIECVLVSSAVDTTGRRKRTYVVETYRAAPKNRIPTNQKPKDATTATDELSSEGQQPQQRLESRVERSSDDFDALRSRIYRHAHEAHSTKLCAFCELVLEQLVSDSANPNAVTKLLIGEAKVMRRLAEFLNHMLAFTKRCSASKGERLCSGEGMIPLLLHDFLMDRDALYTA